MRKIEENTKKLKYLDFLQVAVIYAIVCLSSIYEYAKENSGPLKPGVQTVEGTVKTVIGPIYGRFHDVPFELLMFVDRKVSTQHSLNTLLGLFFSFYFIKLFGGANHQNVTFGGPFC